MNFTDDDLKRLKENHPGHIYTSCPTCSVIASLEAAERVIDNMYTGCSHDSLCKCPPDLFIPLKELDEWRKERGK